MSFDIFLQAFRTGDAADADGNAAMAVLEPFVASRSGDWCRIAVADGVADVYGIDDPVSGLMFNHVTGSLAWDVIVEVARRGGFTILPADCPACVLSEADAAHLPEGLSAGAVVVGSGWDLLHVVERD